MKLDLETSNQTMFSKAELILVFQIWDMTQGLQQQHCKLADWCSHTWSNLARSTGP